MNFYSLFTNIIFYCYLPNFYRVCIGCEFGTYAIKVPYVRSLNNCKPLIISVFILVVFVAKRIFFQVI